MASIEWALWCEFAFRSHEHFLSAIGIHDAIKVKLPGVVERGFLVFGIAGSSQERVQAEISIRQPDDSEVGRVQAGTHALDGRGTRDVLVEILRLPVSVLGTYTFVILLNGESVRRVPLQAFAETEDE